MTREIKQRLMLNFVDNWIATVNRNACLNGRRRNKLRTYRLFKQSFAVETYCYHQIIDLPFVNLNVVLHLYALKLADMKLQERGTVNVHFVKLW